MLFGEVLPGRAFFFLLNTSSATSLMSDSNFSHCSSGVWSEFTRRLHRAEFLSQILSSLVMNVQRSGPPLVHAHMILSMSNCLWGAAWCTSSTLHLSMVRM